MEVSNLVDRLLLLVGTADLDLPLSDFPRFSLEEVGFHRGVRPVNMIKASIVASQIAKRESLNIIHDSFATLAPLLLIKRRYPDIKFVVSQYANEEWRLHHVWNGIPLYRHLLSRGSWKMYVGRLGEKVVLPRTDRVVVQAPGLVPRILQSNRLNPSNVSVITNSVDHLIWAPAGSRPTRSASQPIRLLFVAPLGITRGAPAVLEAFSKMIRKGMHATLTLSGQEEPFSKGIVDAVIEREDLDRHIERRERLSKAELLEAFHTHDILLYQTINDGSPRTVLEAMASGIPIIASHHPGIDVMDPDGKAISFTHYGDIEAMVSLVEDYAKSPEAWHERAIQGRSIIEDLFTPRAVAKQYASMYEKLLSS